MSHNLRNYHHNVLKKAELTYGSRDSVLYTDSDSLAALKDELQDMEDSLDRAVDELRWNQ